MSGRQLSGPSLRIPRQNSRQVIYFKTSSLDEFLNVAERLLDHIKYKEQSEVVTLCVFDVVDCVCDT